MEVHAWKEGCPYSDAVMILLEKSGVSCRLITYVRGVDTPPKEVIRTLPRVYWGQQLIADCSSLMRFIRSIMAQREWSSESADALRRTLMGPPMDERSLLLLILYISPALWACRVDRACREILDSF